MSKKSNSQFSAEDLVAILRKSAPETSNNFLKIIADAKIKTPLVLVAQDQLRTKRLIDWIKSTYFSNSQNAEIKTYFGDELKSAKNVELIINSINSPSLFSNSQLLVIYDFDKIKADLAKKLSETLLQQNLSVCGILTVQSLAKNSALTSISKNGTVVEVAELKGPLLNRWIQKEAIKAGARGGIEPRAIELLAKSHAGDTFSLAQELAKLALLTEEQSQITYALTEALLFKSPEKTSFDLVNAIASGNIVLATSLTLNLLDQGFHPLQLNSFLSKALRTMLANKESGRSSAASFSNPWFLRNLQSAMNKFSENNLIQALEIIKDLDFQLKSSKLSEQSLVVSAIQKLTTLTKSPLTKAA